MRRFRNSADPPVKNTGSSGTSIPDVLVQSIHNSGFETYDEIPDNNAGEEGLPSYNEVQQNHSYHPPTYRGFRAGMRNASLSGEEKPPPVPPSRKSIAFDGAWQRSKTETYVEQIPLPTMSYRFSGARTSNPTSVNSEHRANVYANYTEDNVRLSQLRNQHTPKQPMRKLSPPSRMDSRKYSPRDQPPPLVPRERISLGGNYRTDICPPGERIPDYSNVPPVIQEAEEGVTSGNDDTDAHGYVTVVESVEEQK